MLEKDVGELQPEHVYILLVPEPKLWNLMLSILIFPILGVTIPLPDCPLLFNIVFPIIVEFLISTGCSVNSLT